MSALDPIKLPALVYVILFLGVISISGFAVGSHVTVTPLRPRVLAGENVTLTCHGVASVQVKQSYFWYKDEEKLNRYEQNFTMNEATREDSGRYQCQTSTSNISEVVSLNVTDEPFSLPKIKVTPDPPLEGYDVTIMCDTNLSLVLGPTELQFAFYLKGKIVRGFNTSDQYKIPVAQLWDSGDYSCEVKTSDSVWRKLSNETFIEIEELFSYPGINFSPHQVTEGEVLMVMCDASPFAKPTELLFEFYANGKRVREFSPLNSYTVQEVQLEDSGPYLCVAKTVTGSVQKMGTASFIAIQELFPTPSISVSPREVLEGSIMTVSCDINSKWRGPGNPSYIFYKDGRLVQSLSGQRGYKVTAAQLHNAGSYECEAKYPSGEAKMSKHLKINVQELYLSITVAPTAVTEGDSMRITCYMKPSTPKMATNPQFAFYRDGLKVQEFSPSNIYRVPLAQVQHSGGYTCELRISTVIGKKMRRHLYVHIQELVSCPNITVVPYPQLVQGSAMTLTCDTALNPLAEMTELQFAFYRDGLNVRDFSFSDTYHVPCVQQENSGNYSCEVRSSTSDVRKMSRGICVQIKEWSQRYRYRQFAASVLLLVLVALILYMRRNK
ncbi:Fc receptor-like protein 2 isoform X1 [Xenopus laevis]|uniref:Fc receptor-like protein 2 isoform X1 n=1 Tax=Xenopus laevis TaxID=8355 RepID=A0A8J1LIS4_XENLA|nr:Fc receptor-like protein 2 isoform X1 [Xenopus laevis]